MRILSVLIFVFLVVGQTAYADKLKQGKNTPISSKISEVVGYVQSTSENQMIVNSGPRKLIVDITNIEKDYFDDMGPVEIKAGDKVRIFGVQDENQLAKDEIKAQKIIPLEEAY